MEFPRGGKSARAARRREQRVRGVLHGWGDGEVEWAEWDRVRVRDDGGVERGDG